MERLCNKDLVHVERKMIHHGYTNCTDSKTNAALDECLVGVAVVCLMSVDVVVGLMAEWCLSVPVLSVAARSECLLSVVVGWLSVPLLSLAARSECLLSVVVGWLTVQLMFVAARSECLLSVVVGWLSDPLMSVAARSECLLSVVAICSIDVCGSKV